MKKTLCALLIVLLILQLFAVFPVSGAQSELAGTAALPAPRITKVNIDNSGAIIYWNKVGGAVKYRVYLKNKNSWVKLADTASTHYSYSKAKIGYAYTFTVRCISADGKVFTSGYNKNGFTVRVLAKPVISSVTNTNNGVLLKWNAVPGAARYRVFYKENAGWKKLTDTAAVSAVHSTASNAMITSYTVRCLSADGKYYTSGFDTVGAKNRYYTTPHVSVEYYGTMVNEEKYGQKPYFEAMITWTTSTVVYDWDYFRVLYKKRSENKWHVYATTGGTRMLFHGELGEDYRFAVRNVSPNGKKFLSDYIATDWYSAYVDSPAYLGQAGYPTKWRIVNGDYAPYEDKNYLTFSWSEPGGIPYFTYRIFVEENGKWMKLADQKSVTMFLYDMTELKNKYRDFRFAVRVLSNDKKRYISGYRVLHIVNSPRGINSYTE